MTNESLIGRNVYWFLIDGLSPYHLNSCGNDTVVRNFFDELVEKGILFTNVASTAGGTHASMHSIFSSLMPSANGAEGWARESLRKFDPEIFTLTDLFKYKGYNTFRYCDADGERTVPMSGFDIWESSGYLIRELMDKTHMAKTPRRDRFIQSVKQFSSPMFVYHHIELLHELNAKLGNVWKDSDYERNIVIVANEFKKLLNEYKLNKNDILILSSDHGVVLNKNWLSDGDVNGEHHYEQSVRTFCAIISEGISANRFDKLISSLDIAPTIAEMVLGIDMPGQGISRYPMIKDNQYVQRMVFREKGTYCTNTPSLRNPLTSDVFYVRDNRWKYVYGLNDKRCEWLIDLENDDDYSVNLVNKNTELVKKYREILQNTLINHDIKVRDIYANANFNMKKKDIHYYYSVIINAEKCSEEVFSNISDLAGPYYEIVILGKKEKYRRINVRYIDKSFNQLEETDIKGDYIVYLEGNIEYSEYLLSDLYCIINSYKDKRLIFYDGWCSKRNIINSGNKKRKLLNIRDVYDLSHKNIQFKIHRYFHILNKWMQFSEL